MNPRTAGKQTIRRFSGMPIRTKLVLMIVLVSSIAIVLAGGSFIAYEWYALKQQTVVDLTALAGMIGENCTAALSFNDPSDAQEILKSLRVKRQIEYVYMYRADGEVFTAYRRDENGPIDVPAARPGSGYQFLGDGLLLWQTISLNERVLGSLCLKSDLSPVLSFMRQSAFVICLMILVSCLAAYFLAAGLQKKISVPILSLAETAGKISQTQDYSLRAVKYGEDELGRLTVAFNEMIARVEDRDSALRESEERFRAVIEHAADAILVHDFKGRITDANQAACENSGYSRQELLSMNVGEIEMGFENARDLTEIIGKTSKGKPLTVEGVHRRKDGSTFPIEVRLGRFELNGQEMILALVRDITERKRLEAQLLQAQKMEAVGQLAGGIAHDFNNLLQVISGYGEMALENIERESHAFEDLKEMMDAANRAKKLVMQMLAFSRRQVLNLQDLDVGQVVTNLEKMIRTVVGEHILVEVRAEPGLKTVRADRGQLEQIIMNLCINARDAMPEGGRIDIATGTVEFDRAFCADNPWAQPGRFIVLSVADSGSGMDQETQQRIFEPFFTTKEAGRGTGLGLSMVYGIVRQHNGMIHVYSEPGQGTRFRIYLPVSGTLSASTEEAADVAVRGGSETILLAEDDSSVRSLTKTMLEYAGYTVLVAENGEEAIALFDGHADEIDLALLDVIMPKSNGKEVCERILAIKPKLPVLFSSGYSDGGFNAYSVETENVQFIQKPFHRNDLLQKLRELLEKSGQEDTFL